MHSWCQYRQPACSAHNIEVCDCSLMIWCCCECTSCMTTLVAYMWQERGKAYTVLAKVSWHESSPSLRHEAAWGHRYEKASMSFLMGESMCDETAMPQSQQKLQLNLLHTTVPCKKATKQSTVQHVSYVHTNVASALSCAISEHASTTALCPLSSSTWHRQRRVVTLSGNNRSDMKAWKTRKKL
jgi:hypothetical protein